jgi:hypothetical protein
MNRYIKLLTTLLSASWIIYIIQYFIFAQGGDSEIHIIFAKNLLNGHFLEFNNGYKSGGETSPLYMIMVALGILISKNNIQYIMKIISLLSLIFILYTIYSSSIKDFKSKLFILSIISMPFLIYQTALGMENIIFASILLIIVNEKYNNKYNIDKILPIISIPLFMLRPEAIFIPFWLLILNTADRNKKGIILALLSTLLMIAAYKGLNYYTGIDTLSAGKIRAFISKSDSQLITLLHFNIYINFKIIVAILYLFPILLFTIIYRNKLNSLDYITLGTLFLTPAFMHLFLILPSTHISRYFLFEYCVVFYIFSRKILPNITDKEFFTLYLILFIISISEFYERKSIKFSDTRNSINEMSSDNILKYSDFILSNIESESRPVSIVLTEVQLRGRLDDRFLIWSLDGITDNKLGNYIHDDYIDHFSYFKDRNIQYFWAKIPFENFNINKSKKSLENFLPFTNKKSECVEGIRLTETPIERLYKISTCK